MTKLITIPKFSQATGCRTGSVFNWLEAVTSLRFLSDAVGGSMYGGWSNGWQAAGIGHPNNIRCYSIGESARILEGDEPKRASP